MENDTRSNLREHCLQAHRRCEAANREREAQRAREEQESRLKLVARYLSDWLGHAVTVDALPFEIDGLTFDVRYHYWGGGCGSERRLMLLWECPRCHEKTAEIDVGTDYMLGAFLADPKPNCCRGCKAEEEELRRREPAPPPPLSVEERLTAAIRDLIEEKLSDRDEAEANREYYRQEREDRARRRQEEELRRLEDENRRQAAILEDDLRRTQDQLKRQSRGW